LDPQRKTYKRAKLEHKTGSKKKTVLGRGGLQLVPTRNITDEEDKRALEWVLSGARKEEERSSRGGGGTDEGDTS